MTQCEHYDLLELFATMWTSSVQSANNFALYSSFNFNEHKREAIYIIV